MRGFPVAVALLLAAGGLVAPGCNRVDLAAAPPHSERPSVLLVTIDTLRADHVGAYGAVDARTPILDRLAAEGTRFTTAIASAPLTLPSHASILTGLYPPRHGVRYNGISRLQPSFETLTERLRDAGYATGAVVGSYVLAGKYGLDQGFEHYDDDTRSRGDPAQRPASEVTDGALAWLERAERPFFLWVHYYDPHERYAPPPPFATRFAGRPYDGEIAYVDAELGRLLDSLAARGELDETLIALTSDHGESLGEHLELTHSYTLYDAVLAVPLVFHGPGVPPGRVVEGVVRTVDVAPTLFSLLDLAPFEESDGMDLSPLWSGSSPPADRFAFAETLTTRLEHGWSPLFAIRTRDHHYVRAPRPELYDLASDPGQLSNQIEAQPETQTAAALDAEITRILEDEVHTAEEGVDDETRDQLRSLGYLIPERKLPETGIDPKDGLLALRDLDFEAGDAAFAAHDLVRAEAIFSRVVERLPGSAYARAMLALCYLQTGQAPKAIPHLEVALQLSPELGDHYTALLGDARLLTGDLDAALEAYEKAARMNSENPTAQVGLMLRALRGGSLAEAEAHAARARQITRDRGGGAHLNIGRNWERLGELERALVCFERALRLDPDSSLAHLNLAIILARLGRLEQAALHLEAAGPLRGDPSARNRLGVAYASAGHVDRAEAILRELISEHPDYPSPRRNLATLLRRQGRIEEATELEERS
jgi:arylsulfatase A-like enzyme/Flp pilus assembly protein TadD